MKNTLVSVCITTYNHEKYIEQCLDSILNQKTDFDFEIVLGEDESIDRTRVICKQYAANHPDKIRLFLRSREDVICINGNPTGRFNFIENLRSVRSKYIALCEGDDYWTDPLKLQKQVDFLEQNKDYFSVSANSNVHISNKRISSQLSGDLVIHDFINGNKLGRNSAAFLFRNDNLNEFLICLKKYSWPFGDLLLVFWCLKNGKCRVLEGEMVYYRVHDQGVWTSSSSLQRCKSFILFYTLLFKSNINPEYDFILFNRSIDWLLNIVMDVEKPLVVESQKDLRFSSCVLKVKNKIKKLIRL